LVFKEVARKVRTETTVLDALRRSRRSSIVQAVKAAAAAAKKDE
jgi:hypothetical protein